jgi:hypothetical protein
VAEWRNESIEKTAAFAMDIIHAVRSQRATFGLTTQRPQLFVNLHSQQLLDDLLPFIVTGSLLSVCTDHQQDTITFLGRSESTTATLNQPTPEGCAVQIVNENCEVFLRIKVSTPVFQLVTQAPKGTS